MLTRPYGLLDSSYDLLEEDSTETGVGISLCIYFDELDTQRPHKAQSACGSESVARHELRLDGAARRG